MAGFYSFLSAVAGELPRCKHGLGEVSSQMEGAPVNPDVRGQGV